MLGAYCPPTLANWCAGPLDMLLDVVPARRPHTYLGPVHGSPQYMANTPHPGPYLGAIDIQYLAGALVQVWALDLAQALALALN